jgi:hypothetical protein
MIGSRAIEELPMTRLSLHGRWQIEDGRLVWRQPWRKRSIAIPEIEEVWATKLDKWIYDEDFLLICSGNSQVSAGELDTGFACVADALVNQLPGFPVNWRSRLPQDCQEQILLWRREQRPGA